MAKREKGIRVRLCLFLPYKDVKGMVAAGTAAEKLTTKEGLSALRDLPGVEIESAKTENIARTPAA